MSILVTYACIFTLYATLESKVDERGNIVRLGFLVSKTVKHHEPELIPCWNSGVRDECLHVLHSSVSD